MQTRPFQSALYVVSVRQTEVLPAGTLFSPHIRLLSDSASRRTPLSSANSSYCQVCSGLSPPSYYACRAHTQKRPLRYRFHREGRFLTVIQLFLLLRAFVDYRNGSFVDFGRVAVLFMIEERTDDHEHRKYYKVEKNGAFESAFRFCCLVRRITV